MIEVMPKPRLPHLIRERSRHGRIVWYFRMGKGARIRLPDAYGSPEFLAAYNAALTGGPPAASERAGKGSLAWLIHRYRESSAWAGLSEATRYQRDRIFAGVIEKAGTVAYADITAANIRKGREDRQATPFMANNYLRAVKGLFVWATEAEFIAENVAADVTEIAVKTKGHEPWTAEDVRRFEARWPEGTRERVWLHTLLFTGFRLGDACAVGWQHVSTETLEDGSHLHWIGMRAEKTGEWLEIPVLPPLAATLEAGPTADLAWISNAHGRPFVKEAFGNAFRDACRAAGITGKSAHGLRKALASIAAEIGASEEMMQAWFGWQSNRMSSIYTRGASKKAMAGKLGDLFAARMKTPRTFDRVRGTTLKSSMKTSAAK